MAAATKFNKLNEILCVLRQFILLKNILKFLKQNDAGNNLAFFLVMTFKDVQLRQTFLGTGDAGITFRDCCNGDAVANCVRRHYVLSVCLL